MAKSGVEEEKSQRNLQPWSGDRPLRPAAETGETLADRAADAVQKAILSGAIKPGERLPLPQLAERFEIGVTPLREGLARLAAVGLVASVGQRGFQAAPISSEDLFDLTHMRLIVELEALQRSIRHGDDEWEIGIIAALHRLKKLHRVSGADLDASDYDLVHRRFHTSLLAACGSPRLIQLHEQFYDQANRYRRLLLPQIGAAGGGNDHEDLANAALERDTDRACQLLAAHLKLSARACYPDQALIEFREGP